MALTNLQSYLELLSELCRLINEGRGDSDEAGRLRGRMARYWRRRLTPDGIAQAVRGELKTTKKPKGADSGA